MNSQKIKMPKIELKADGTWIHDSEIITHERTCQDMFQRIYFEEGSYYLTGENTRVPVVVEEAAYFVRSLERTPEGYKIGLSNGTTETLDLTKLEIGKSGALFAKVTEQNVPAKFERKTYNDIMGDLNERDSYYGLTVQGLFYPLRPVKEGVLEVLAPKVVLKKFVKKLEVKKVKVAKVVKKSAKPVKKVTKLVKKSTKRVKVPKAKGKKIVVKKPIAKPVKKTVKKAVKKVVKKIVKKTAAKKTKKKR